MTSTEKPWVILVTDSTELRSPIVGIPRIKGQQFAHKAGRLRRFATKQEAERFLATSVEKRANRCYMVTTL